MEVLFEALQTLLKCKDNRVMFKNLKLQNTNWSYMPTHVPMTPFTWRTHILFKPSSIWTIFVALNAPSEALQKFSKQYSGIQRSLARKCKLVICANPHHAHDSLHLEKTYLAQTFIDLNNFCCIRCTK